jgi:hypothetical protein
VNGEEATTPDDLATVDADDGAALAAQTEKAPRS